MTGSITHRNLAPPRMTALAGIVALHVLIAYLLLTALVQRPSAEAPADITVTSIDTYHPPPVPTPPLQPGPTTRARPTPIPVPEPLVPPTPSHEDSAPDGTVVPPGPASPSPPEPIRVLGKHWLPNSAGYYSPVLIREGVEGDSTVRVCVDEAGHLSGAPVVERSSGDARLDQGAVNVARAGRYARAVRGDTPVANCYLFRIVFKVK